MRSYLTWVRVVGNRIRKCILRSTIITSGLLVAALATSAEAQSVRKFDIFEKSVTNPKNYSNKFDFNVIELQTTFTAPSGKITSFFGFHDGDGNGGQNGNVWKFRFMPDEAGTWSYSYRWTDGTPGGSGSFTVFDDGSLPGPLKLAADNTWYFMNSRGQPFHFRGYDLHHYLFFSGTNKITRELDQFKSTIQSHVIDRGYNFVMWQSMGDRVESRPDAEAGESWWLSPSDTKRFSIPVWTAYEETLDMAKNAGVYAITFAMLSQGSQYAFADMQVFLRYWVARFAAYYNFFGWSPSWEWMDIWSPDDVDQIMQYVRDIDPWKRLLTSHDNAYSTFTSWLSFSMRQAPSQNVFMGNSRRAGQQQIADSNGSGGIGDPFINKPIIGSEDIWESPIADQWPEWTVPRNRTEARRGSWGIMMAGVLPLYSDYHAWAPSPGGVGQGEGDVRRMFDFFYSKTNYRLYKQLNSLVSASARQIASGISGQEYLVYDEDGGSITINLSGASGSFSVLWFDPKTGAEQAGTAISGGGARTLTSPHAGDSVLLLKAGGEAGASPSPATPSAGQYALAASPTSVAPGGQVTLKWSAPAGRSASDWVGFFKVGDPNQSYDPNRWIHAGGGTSGSYTITAPSTPGNYEFRYILDGAAYSTASISNPVAVTAVSTPSAPPSAPAPSAPSVSGITGPAKGSIFTPGQRVTAQGVGSNLAWSIDRIGDGLPAFASGGGASFSFTVPADATPNQTINITLAGAGGYLATQTHAIAGASAPAPVPAPAPSTASITAPAKGASLSPGQRVTAQGVGANLTWSVDRIGDGLPDFASGAGSSFSFTVPADASSTQTIVIKLTGAGGSSATQTHAIGSASVPAPAPTPAPAPSTAGITAPAKGALLSPGQQVMAQGVGSNLAWSIDRIGDGLPDFASGTGSSFSFTVPADADPSQTIVIKLTGAGGYSASQTHAIGSAAQPAPTPGVSSITAPTPGTVFTPGQRITVQATGANLAWSIDRIGDGLPAFASGTGSSISFTVPADATPSQTINITLTGAGGYSATQTHSIK